MLKHSKKSIDKGKAILIQQSGKEHSHLFNAKEILSIIKYEDYIELLEKRNQENIIYKVLEQLNNLSPNESWVISIPKSKFMGIRAIYGDYDPLDTAGTLSDGGRLNIGGAQQYNKNGNLFQKKAGLYFADSVETALLELSLPKAVNIKLPKFYNIVFNDKVGNLNLFHFESVLSYLDNLIQIPTSLINLCSEAPLAGSWGQQKFPSISQVIAQWLRNTHTAEGIIFNSTKKTNSKNYFLFFEDTKEAKNKLNSNL